MALISASLLLCVGLTPSQVALRAAMQRIATTIDDEAEQALLPIEVPPPPPPPLPGRAAPRRRPAVFVEPSGVFGTQSRPVNRATLSGEGLPEVQAPSEPQTLAQRFDAEADAALRPALRPSSSQRAREAAARRAAAATADDDDLRGMPERAAAWLVNVFEQVTGDTASQQVQQQQPQQLQQQQEQAQEESQLGQQTRSVGQRRQATEPTIRSQWWDPSSLR